MRESERVKEREIERLREREIDFVAGVIGSKFDLCLLLCPVDFLICYIVDHILRLELSSRIAMTLGISTKQG